MSVNVLANGWHPWPQTPSLFQIPVNSTGTLNDDTDEIAYPILVPKTGTLTNVQVAANSVSVAGQLDLRLETVGSDGNPSGTLYDANGTGSVAMTTGTQHIYTISINGGTGISVTVGDEIFVRMKRPTSDTLTMTLRAGPNPTNGWPAIYDYNITTGTTWTKNSWQPMIAVTIGGSTVVPVGCQLPFATSNNEAFQSPVERGLYLVSPTTIRAIGAYAWVNLLAGGGSTTCKMSLYADPTGTPSLVASTAAHNANAFRSSTNSWWYQLFTSSVTLSGGAPYVLAVSPQGAVNVALFYANDANFPANALPSGPSAYWYGRANGSSAFTSDTSRVPAMGLIVDAVGESQQITIPMPPF